MACVWTKENTYCETHCCGFADPCLAPGCPHCGTAPDRRYYRAVGNLAKLDMRIEELEKKLYRTIGRLVKLRKARESTRKRLFKLEESLKNPPKENP